MSPAAELAIFFGVLGGIILLAQLAMWQWKSHDYTSVMA